DHGGQERGDGPEPVGPDRVALDGGGGGVGLGDAAGDALGVGGARGGVLGQQVADAHGQEREEQHGDGQQQVGGLAPVAQTGEDSEGEGDTGRRDGGNQTEQQETGDFGEHR